MRWATRVVLGEAIAQHSGQPPLRVGPRHRVLQHGIAHGLEAGEDLARRLGATLVHPLAQLAPGRRTLEAEAREHVRVQAGLAERGLDHLVPAVEQALRPDRPGRLEGPGLGRLGEVLLHVVEGLLRLPVRHGLAAPGQVGDEVDRHVGEGQGKAEERRPRRWR